MNIKVESLYRRMEGNVAAFKSEWKKHTTWLTQLVEEFEKSDSKENFKIQQKSPAKRPFYDFSVGRKHSCWNVVAFEDKPSAQPEASADGVGSPALRKSVLPFKHITPLQEEEEELMEDTPLYSSSLMGQPMPPPKLQPTPMPPPNDTTPMPPPNDTPVRTQRGTPKLAKKNSITRNNSVKKLIEQYEDRTLSQSPVANTSFRMKLRSNSKLTTPSATPAQKRESVKRTREDSTDATLPPFKKLHIQESAKKVEKTPRKNPVRSTRFNTRISYSNSGCPADSKTLKWAEKKVSSVTKLGAKASLKVLRSVTRNDSLLANSKPLLTSKLLKGGGTLAPGKGLHTPQTQRTTPLKGILRTTPSQQVRASPMVESLRTQQLKEELGRKDLKHEEVLKAQEEAKKLKLEENKRKREEKMRKVKEQKEQQEREKEEKLRLKEEQKEQYKEMEKLRQQEKLKLQAQLKKKKEADVLERKRQEDQARQIKQAEMAKIELLKHQEAEKQRQKEIKMKAIAQGNLPQTPGKKALCNGTPTSQPKTPDPAHQTFTMEVPSNNQVCSDSYAMTPLQPIVISPDPEDYGLEDLHSGGESDDESQPKKPIPDWARSHNLKPVLWNQFTNLPDYTKIFGTIKPPNLTLIFQTEKKGFNKRTSSAIWEPHPLSISFKDRSTTDL